MDLAKRIYLYNDAREAFEDRWDGKDYRITKEPLEIEYGVAEHWMKRNPDAKLRVEEIPDEEIEKRKPQNPLEENSRGQAFSGLKKRGPRVKASGE